MEKITSLQNRKVKEWASLQTKKGRDQLHQFLVETDHLIQEARMAGVLQSVLSDEEGDIFVDSSVLKKLKTSQSSIHQIGLCEIPSFEEKDYQRVIMLDEVQDPGNFGTIVRSAKAFGFEAIYCSKNSCDPYNPKCVQSSQGAIFTMPIFRRDLENCIPFLQEKGMKVLGTSLQESIPLKKVSIKSPLAILVGNEGRGVKPALLKLCNQITRIEMDGFESLNVAIAASILMYTFQEDN